LSKEIKKVKLLKPVSGFLLFTFFATCIDPFNPEVGGFKSLLVVDALVTDENASYYCFLTRTFEKLSDRPEEVTGASVYVKDDLGEIFVFNEVAPGKYRSDSLSFRGSPGRSYVLTVTTKEGEEYESEPATMLKVPQIDSLYFGPETMTDDKGKTWNGIMIYLDAEKDPDVKYLRWTYEETWKFRVPLAVAYEFIDQNHIPRIPLKNYICWKHHLSDTVIIASAESDTSAEFRKKAFLFIAPEKSDRLNVRYYINVRQYSVSKDEYVFWKNIKEIREAGGDIFDRQPFQLMSNIHNLNKPQDQVLGYFQVSAAKNASLFIDFDDIYSLNLLRYQYKCEWFEIGVNDDLPFPGPPLIMTFQAIYDLFIQHGYVFLAPVYPEDGNTLLKLTFTNAECSDCTRTGNPVRPDFWTD
jgi:hypothetical protein